MNYAWKNAQTYPKESMMWNIDFGCPVKKSPTKTTQDIVKSLCTSLLYIKQKLCT